MSEPLIKCFYGGCKRRKTQDLERQARVHRRVQFYRNHSIPDNINYGILGPSTSWYVFPTQQQALEAARIMALMVFSFETPVLTGGGESLGKRSFVAADPRVFFDSFRKRPVSERATYEVIPMNNRSKLYFDLEFETEYNKDRDGVEMTGILVTVVKFFLRKHFKIACSDREVIDLDSCTERKFSKHLIFNLNEIVFKNNHHVGNFVKMIQHSIEDACSSNACDIDGVSVEELSTLFVADKNNRRKLFIDLGVYSRNRNFRVFMGSKLTHNTPLVLAKNSCNFEYYRDNNELLFLDSLVTFVSSLLTEVEFGQERDESNSCAQIIKHNIAQSSSDRLSLAIYPELDAFIAKQVTPGQVHGSQYYSDTQCMVYSIEGFRYCHNIHRAHKSNGIILIANIKKRVWYQKCLDPDCHGFMSNEWPLPANVLSWLDDETDFESHNVE